jgi:hypothetical protein
VPIFDCLGVKGLKMACCIYNETSKVKAAWLKDGIFFPLLSLKVWPLALIIHMFL